MLIHDIFLNIGEILQKGSHFQSFCVCEFIEFLRDIFIIALTWIRSRGIIIKTKIIRERNIAMTNSYRFSQLDNHVVNSVHYVETGFIADGKNCFVEVIVHMGKLN